MITRLKAIWIVLRDGRMAYNVVEDVRLEGEIAKLYPNMARTLNIKVPYPRSKPPR